MPRIFTKSFKYNMMISSFQNFADLSVVKSVKIIVKFKFIEVHTNFRNGVLK